MLTLHQEDAFVLAQSKPNCLLVHCISSDLAMGAGFAKAVRETTGRPSSSTSVGKAILQSDCLGGVGYHLGHLVTKSCYWEKPPPSTYLSSLRSSLQDLMNQWKASRSRPPVIVCPKIGCGLDRMKWTDVKLILEELDCDVHVCYL